MRNSQQTAADGSNKLIVKCLFLASFVLSSFFVNKYFENSTRTIIIDCLKSKYRFYFRYSLVRVLFCFVLSRLGSFRFGAPSASNRFVLSLLFFVRFIKSIDKYNNII